MAITILIADDEKEILENLAVLLEEIGYEVFQASDGEQALQVIGEKSPDIVILDIEMPRKNGEQVLKELEAFPTKPKVIVSTGRSVHDKTMKDRILKAFKVSAFLEKPTSVDEMDYVIKEVLKHEDVE